jgi:hypothetical protein
VLDPVSFPDHLSRPREDPNLLLEPTSEPILLDLELITGLNVQPEPLGGAGITGETEGGVGGDGPLLVDDLVDPARVGAFCEAFRTPFESRDSRRSRR